MYKTKIRLMQKLIFLFKYLEHKYLSLTKNTDIRNPKSE